MDQVMHNQRATMTSSTEVMFSNLETIWFYSPMKQNQYIWKISALRFFFEWYFWQCLQYLNFFPTFLTSQLLRFLLSQVCFSSMGACHELTKLSFMHQPQQQWFEPFFWELSHWPPCCKATWKAARVPGLEKVRFIPSLMRPPSMKYMVSANVLSLAF